MQRPPLFGLLLAVMLALSSVTIAVARGQVAVGGTIVICSGYGLVSVALDADGNPVGPLHPCPECLAGWTSILVAHTALPLRPQTRSTRLLSMASALPLARSAPVASARDRPRFS